MYLIGSSEYSAFWKCVQAGVAYLVTQLCKMLFLATFFPASDAVSGQMDLLGVSGVLDWNVSHKFLISFLKINLIVEL